MRRLVTSRNLDLHCLKNYLFGSTGQKSFKAINVGTRFISSHQASSCEYPQDKLGLESNLIHHLIIFSS